MKNPNTVYVIKSEIVGINKIKNNNGLDNSNLICNNLFRLEGCKLQSLGY